MTDKDKESLANKQLTDTLIIASLARCETVIGKNAYNEKKYKDAHMCLDQTWDMYYKDERLVWSKHREKLRSLLLPIYSMKDIIQLTKSCKDKATQKELEDVIDLIANGDYTLV